MGSENCVTPVEAVRQGHGLLRDLAMSRVEITEGRALLLRPHTQLQMQQVLDGVAPAAPLSCCQKPEDSTLGGLGLGLSSRESAW